MENIDSAATHTADETSAVVAATTETSEQDFARLSTREKLALIQRVEDANRYKRMQLALMVCL